MPKFQKGISGNPGGRPRLPAEMREMFRAKAPEAFEVLSRHLQSPDAKVAIAAATQILDRAYGRPVQSLDANITEDGGPVRYYAELPKKAESTEAWLILWRLVGMARQRRIEPQGNPASSDAMIITTSAWSYVTPTPRQKAELRLQ